MRLGVKAFVSVRTITLYFVSVGHKGDERDMRAHVAHICTRW